MIRNKRILSAICALMICVFIMTFGLSSCTKRSKADPHDAQDTEEVSAAELPPENTGSEDNEPEDTPVPAEDTEPEPSPTPTPSAGGQTTTQLLPGQGLPEFIISINTGNRNPDSAGDAAAQNTAQPVNNPSSPAMPSPSSVNSNASEPDNNGMNDIQTTPQPVNNPPSPAVPSPSPVNSTVPEPDNSGDILLPELP